jgi:hypothetical protein
MKIMKSLLLSVAMLLVSALPAVAQTMTPNTTKTLTDFDGTWTGVTCLDSTHPRFEQFIISQDTAGNPSVDVTFLGNDGTTQDLGTVDGDSVMFSNGMLGIKFVSNSTHAIGFVLAFWQGQPDDLIGGVALYADGDSKETLTTVLSRGAVALSTYAQQHANICTATAGTDDTN